MRFAAGPSAPAITPEQVIKMVLLCLTLAVMAFDLVEFASAFTPIH